MAGNIACVDIGSSKICTIIANVSDKKIVDIMGVGSVPSRGVQKGIVMDIEDATAAIRDSIEQAQSGSAPKVSAAVVGFTGKHISSTNPMVSVDTRRRDHLVTELAIAQAERKMQAVVFPEDRVKVNIVKRQYALDRVEGIRNPLGMHGFRLDLEAHIVTADYAYMENLALCLKRAGVWVTSDSFIASPLAAAEAVLEPEDKLSGAIVADIGGGTTGISVFRDGTVWHTSALPVGSRQITNDLAVGLNIPFSAAEELKIKAGNLYPEQGGNGESLELISKYGTSPEEVSYIIRARMEEIVRMILSKSPHVPNIMVLTGGAARLRGMESFAREISGLQVRTGIPRVLPQDTKGLDDPMFASAVGLLLWGSTREGISDGSGSGPLEGLFKGIRNGLQSLWNSRPRISFGPPTTKED